MNTITQRDQLFYTAQNLSFDDLRRFCQLDSAHRALCAEPRFQALIQQRYSEEVQATIRNVLDKIKNTPGPVTLLYELVGNMRSIDRVHMIDVYKNENQEVEFIEETIVGIPVEKSFLYQLFKTKSGFKGLENLSRDEFVDLAQQLDPDEYQIDVILNEPYGKYFLLDAIMREEGRNFEASAAYSGKFNEQAFEYEELDVPDSGRLKFGYPTDADLQDMATYIGKNYRNATEKMI